MNDEKNVFIIGDSYSTFAGHIPEGYRCYYGEREDTPVLAGVEKTWWRILSREKKLKVVLNDSFSGSTICNTVREILTVESSFVSRIDKYVSENFFAENEIDTVFIFGGTNDSWINAPVGELKYSDWSRDDLMCVLPAFCYLLSRAKKVARNVIAIINSDLKNEIAEGLVEACEKNGIRYVCLDNIDKEKGHPTELGMKQIADQVAGYIS